MDGGGDFLRANKPRRDDLQEFHPPIKPFEGKPEPTALENELLFTESELATPIATAMEEAPITDADLKKEWKMEDYADLV